MRQLKIALLQKSSSPLRNMIQQALDQTDVMQLDPAAPPTLAEDVLVGGRLLLWDLEGFDRSACQAWAALVRPQEVGLVLAARPLHPEIQRLALDCGALGLIGPHHDPGLAGLALQMAARLQEGICRCLARQAQLSQQLADREVIERAKSILIAALGLSEPAAMSQLQQQARRSNQKLVEVARKVIATNRLFNGKQD